MKNMNVGTKIMAGFVSVILMIAIILTLTVITSLTRNRDLRTVEHMSQLQYEANNMLDDLNTARIDMAIVFTTIDNDAQYQAAMDNLAIAAAHITVLDEEIANIQANGYHSELVESLPGINRQLEELYSQIDAGMQAINSNDIAVLENIAGLAAAEEEMDQSINDIFGFANNNIRTLATENPGNIPGFVDNLLTPLEEVKTKIADLRVISQEVANLQDLSVIPDILTLLDEIDALVSAARPNAATEAGQALFGVVLERTAAYREEIQQIKEVIADSDARVAATQTVLAELSSTIHAGVDAISAESASLIETTTKNSVFVMWIILGTSVAAVIFSIIVAIYLSRLITKPLGKMKEALIQVGTTGSLEFPDDVKEDIRKEAMAKDEIGQSIAAFVQTIERIIYIGDSMTQVANRDLSHDVELLGPEDTMGKALEDMTSNLNQMFAEINSVASQVATASGEIAVGAQSLAQGSTEQASTVEEISASIGEITEQASVSVETASDAATESAHIRDIALEGNGKMSNLSTAVQQMSDASNSIEQVIKVIDDIAFQTNILALNAAVEAARAGEHGKGFAVVADEVRNLAGKSADAAKETSALISANIEKAGLGLSLSQDTAATLNEIVEGVEKTTLSLNTIAEQSNSSKAATQQVNHAVDQVAQVVQQNSATSEQSAAASQEMSSQAQVLQQLIAEFRLKDTLSYESQAALPEASHTSADPGEPDDLTNEEPIVF